MSVGGVPREFRDEFLLCGRCGPEFISGAAGPSFRSKMRLKPPRFCKTCRRKMRREEVAGGWW